MIINYFIILHGFIVVLSSATNQSSLISIIKTRDSNSITFSTTNHYDILSQWFHHSNIKIHLHITSKSYKTSHSPHFINILARSLRHRSNKKKDLSSSIFPRRTLINTSLVNNVNRMVNISEKEKNTNHTRIRRHFSRENTIDDEEDANVYGGDDDGRNFRNQQEEIIEQRQGFDGKYYLPIENKFKMRDDNGLNENDIDRINRARNEDRDAEKRFMQNDEELINPDRLFNDRQYNGKKFHEKDMDDYNRMLKNQGDRNGKKFENDYQDQLELED